jgi:polyhydroxybutyrate depolymerase
MNFAPSSSARLRSCLALALGALSFGCSVDDVDVGNPSTAGGSAGTTSTTSGGSSAGATTTGASGSAAQVGGSGDQSIVADGGGGGGGAGGAGGGTAGGAGGMTSAGGAGPAAPSPGCGMAAGQALGSWVEQPKLSVNAKDRQWWIWLPTGYDPAKAYPVVFTFHGCGGPDNYLPMQKVAGDKAILVRGTGITDDGCWQYGATGDDVKFFDAMLAELEAKRCVDQGRVFTTGYSSGSWLVNTLNCERGDKLRASGSVSGGVAVNTAKCPGSATPANPAQPKEFARIFLHDLDDTTNKFMGAGNDKELARLIAANHCMPTAPVPEDPAPCARYQGCDAGMPVIMCHTMGKMHDRQDTLATTAFWKLFSSL